MESLIEMIKTDAFLLIVVGMVVILFIGFIVMIIQYSKLNKRYCSFMKKLGEGKNLEEDLETYMYRVDKVEKQNAEISHEIKSLGKDLTKCVQKIGIVRYSAFKDTGSDLSFTLAMLDEDNSGVVLNGIYSREMSNIYAKQVREGKTNTKLTEEEKQALEIALNQEN